MCHYKEMVRTKLMAKTKGTAFECKRFLGVGCGKNPRVFRASISMILNTELVLSEAEDLFNMLDTANNGEVSAMEIVAGLLPAPDPMGMAKPSGPSRDGIHQAPRHTRKEGHAKHLAACFDQPAP